MAVAGTARVGASAGVQRIAQTLSTAAAVGASEASGTFQQTVNAVLSLSQEDLELTSDRFRDLVASGLSPEEAQTRLAVDTGNEAFGRQLPVATAIGLISSRFERSPIEAFDGATVPSIAREIASQTIEEGLQGGTGQINQNAAIQNQVDADQSLLDGVGENVAVGAIAGTGLAGTFAAPSAAGLAVGGALEGTANAIDGTRRGIGSLVDADLTSDTLGAIGDVASGIGSGIATGAGAVGSALSPGTSAVGSAAATLAAAGTGAVVGGARAVGSVAAPIVSGAADVAVNAARQAATPVAQAGRIAFNTLAPAAQATGQAAVQTTRLAGRLALGAGRAASPAILSTAQAVGNQVVAPAARGTIAATRVILPAVTQASSLVGTVGAPIANRVGQVSANVALEFSEPIIRSLQNISEIPVRREFSRANAQLNDVFNEIRSSFNDDAIDNIPDHLTDLVLVQDDTQVPEELSGVASSEQSVLLNAVGVLNFISSSDTDITSLSQESLVYAGNRFRELQRLSDTNEGLRTELADVLNNPEIQRLTQVANNVDLNRNVDETTEVNPDTTATTLTVARTNPSNVNPDYVNRLLNHSDRRDLTEEDIRLLQAAARIAESVNNHVGQQVEIASQNRVSLSTRAAFNGREDRLPEVPSIESVSRSIQVGGFTDAQGNQLRSITDFAADVFEAAQNEDGAFTNRQGIRVQGQTVVDQLRRFVTHFENKVDALNESFDRNNDRGIGPEVAFDSLVGGERIVPAGSPGAARPVFFNQSSPESARLAAEVHNDATIAGNVLNTLLDTFPNLTAERANIPALRQVPNNAPTAEANSDADAIQDTETTPETNTETQEDTTVVEEVAADADTQVDVAVDTDEQQNTNTETNTETEAPAESDQNTDTQVDTNTDTTQDATPDADTETNVDTRTDTVPNDADNAVQRVLDNGIGDLNRIFSRREEVRFQNGVESVVEAISNIEDSASFLETYNRINDLVAQPIQDVLDLPSDKREGTTTTIRDIVQNQPSLLNNPRFVQLGFIDQNTGNISPEIISAITLSLTNWVSTARTTTQSFDNIIQEGLNIRIEDLTQSLQDITDPAERAAQIAAVTNNFDIGDVTTQIANDVLNILELNKSLDATPVSYTHLTLPTIYSV